MFILLALPLGLLAGLMRGGRLEGLAEMRFRWPLLALAGLLLQLVLFFGPVAERAGAIGTPIYVGSTALVAAAVIRNLRVPGLPVVAAGAVSNLLAIVANGGHMPAAPEALAALGKTIQGGYSNSVLVDRPLLAPLTDIFALPAGMPFANVFSVGDVLIGIGVGWAVAAAMRHGASGNLVPR